MRLSDWLRPRPLPPKPAELSQAEFELRREQLLDQWRRQDEADERRKITEARAKTRFEAWEQSKEDAERLSVITNETYDSWHRWYTSPAGQQVRDDPEALYRVIEERRDELEKRLVEDEETQGVVEGAIANFNSLVDPDLNRSMVRRSERGRILLSQHQAKARQRHLDAISDLVPPLYSNLYPDNQEVMADAWANFKGNEVEYDKLYANATSAEMAKAFTAYRERVAEELIPYRLQMVDPETEELTEVGKGIIKGNLPINMLHPGYGTFQDVIPSRALREAMVLTGYRRIQLQRDAENAADARAHETHVEVGKATWKTAKGDAIAKGTTPKQEYERRGGDPDLMTRFVAEDMEDAKIHNEVYAVGHRTRQVAGAPTDEQRKDFFDRLEQTWTLPKVEFLDEQLNQLKHTLPEEDFSQYEQAVAKAKQRITRVVGDERRMFNRLWDSWMAREGVFNIGNIISGSNKQRLSHLHANRNTLEVMFTELGGGDLAWTLLDALVDALREGPWERQQGVAQVDVLREFPDVPWTSQTGSTLGIRLGRDRWARVIDIANRPDVSVQTTDEQFMGLLPWVGALGRDLAYHRETKRLDIEVSLLRFPDQLQELATIELEERQQLFDAIRGVASARNAVVGRQKAVAAARKAALAKQAEGDEEG